MLDFPSSKSPVIQSSIRYKNTDLDTVSETSVKSTGFDKTFKKETLYFLMKWSVKFLSLPTYKIHDENNTIKKAGTGHKDLIRKYVLTEKKEVIFKDMGINEV